MWMGKFLNPESKSCGFLADSTISRTCRKCLNFLSTLLLILKSSDKIVEKNSGSFRGTKQPKHVREKIVWQVIE